MSIQIGGVDPAKEIAELWFELVKTQAILEKVIEKVAEKQTILSKKELSECEDIALKIVQSRFPNLGIKRK